MRRVASKSREVTLPLLSVPMRHCRNAKPGSSLRSPVIGQEAMGTNQNVVIQLKYEKKMFHCKGGQS